MLQFMLVEKKQTETVAGCLVFAIGGAEKLLVVIVLAPRQDFAKHPHGRFGSVLHRPGRIGSFGLPAHLGQARKHIVRLQSTHTVFGMQT